MNHDDSGSGGCFSGIGRLLLCKGSLQTHPSDVENILNNKEFSNNNSALMPNLKVEEAPHSTTANPGVVARLMGLDSFPLPDPNLLVTRSRSVNFIDYYLPPSFTDHCEVDHQFKQQKQKHRRVRTCVSFREDDHRCSDPVVFGNENEHDFFVFSLDNDHHQIEKTKKKPENEVARRIRKQTIVENIIVKQKQLEEKNKKMIRPEGVPVSKSRFGSCKQVSSGLLVSNPKKNGVPLKKNKQKKAMIINQKEVVVESKFINKIKDHHQLPLSERKNSPKMSNYNKLNKSTEQKRVTEEVKRLRRLTEEDMKESKLEIKFENIEEMCLYFGEQIVDLLVEKLVEELLLH